MSPHFWVVRIRCSESASSKGEIEHQFAAPLVPATWPGEMADIIKYDAVDGCHVAMIECTGAEAVHG